MDVLDAEVARWRRWSPDPYDWPDPPGGPPPSGFWHLWSETLICMDIGDADAAYDYARRLAGLVRSPSGTWRTDH